MSRFTQAEVEQWLRDCRDECLRSGNHEFAAVFQETIDAGIKPADD